MRALLLLVAVTAANDYVPSSRVRETARMRGRDVQTNSLAFFEFAPASGAGLTGGIDLCSAWGASDKAGNYWCVRGDGTVEGYSLGMSALGSPTYPSYYSTGYTPSSITNYPANSALQSAATFNAGTGAVTVCGLARVDGQSGFTIASNGLNSLAANFGFYMRTEAFSALRPDFAVSDGTTITAATHGSSMTLGAWHLICGRWTSAVGADVFLDGVKGPTTAGATRWAGNQKVTLHSAGAGLTGSSVPGAMRGVFFTESALSDARIAELTAAVLGSTKGAKGEALTFTRGSVAYAQRTASGGLATTGIADGDLILMPANQPRIEYDSAGKLKLLVESSRTNSILRSQEFENAAWTKGAAVGTITANYATAPDGTLTADRYQYSNTNADYVLQSFSVGGLAASTSVYLKGTSGSGTIYMCRGGGVGQCVTCSYVSTSWSRCRYEGTLAASSNVFFGCDTPTLGTSCAQTGFDVLIWGIQGELGAYATSYIPTTTVAVNRPAEVPYLTMPVTMSPRCLSATAQIPWTVAASNARIARVDSNSSDNNRFELFIGSGTTTAANYTSVSAVNQQTNASGSTPLPGLNRFVARRLPSTTQSIVLNGTTTSAATALGEFPVLNRVYVGVYAATGSELDGLVGEVQADPNDMRCSP